VEPAGSAYVRCPVQELLASGRVVKISLRTCSSFEMTPPITAQLTRRLTEILHTDLGVAADFAYLFFETVEASHLTAWNGRTFAEILDQQGGSREELRRRVRGRLVNKPSVARAAREPLGGLRLELWDPNPVGGVAEGVAGQNISRFLGSGVSSPDGS